MTRSCGGQAIISAVALLFLAGCQEDEKACYDRIAGDLDRTAELSAKSGNHEYALAARETALSALLIYYDDDRSICDYATAGAYLERK